MELYIAITKEEALEIKKEKPKLVSIVETADGKLHDCVKIELPEMTKAGVTKQIEVYLNEQKFVNERNLLGKIYADGLMYYNSQVKKKIQELFKK